MYIPRYSKDYSDAMESLKKCREYGAKYICLPHFGMLPQYFNERYWGDVRAACREKLGFVGDMVSRSLTEDQMTDEYIKDTGIPHWRKSSL